MRSRVPDRSGPPATLNEGKTVQCEFCYEDVHTWDECWCDPENGCHHEECHADDATDEEFHDEDYDGF
jgi:hypothetical protein